MWLPEVKLGMDMSYSYNPMEARRQKARRVEAHKVKGMNPRGHKATTTLGNWETGPQPMPSGHQLKPPMQVAGHEAAKLHAAPKPMESPVVSTKSQMGLACTCPRCQY